MSDKKSKIGIDPKRITTGIALFIGVVLIGIVHSFLLIWLVLGALYFLAFSEAIKLFDIKNNTLYYYAVALWIMSGIYPYPEDVFFIGAILFGSILAYKKELKPKYFFPFLYPTVGFLFTLALYNEYGIISLAWLVAVVAGADIGAYFVGKTIGKTKFSETSPNKTLEGVFGGLFVSVGLGILIGSYLIDDYIAILFISFFSGLASVFGDLFESYLKRKAGVKDSGNILPGHGGILDRIDGYLFASIIMLFLLRAFG